MGNTGAIYTGNKVKTDSVWFLGFDVDLVFRLQSHRFLPFSRGHVAGSHVSERSSGTSRERPRMLGEKRCLPLAAIDLPGVRVLRVTTVVTLRRSPVQWLYETMNIG